MVLGEPTEQDGAVRRPAPSAAGNSSSADNPLSRCVGVPEATFAAEIWDRRPLFTPADAGGTGFADLFSTAAVDELVSRRGLRTPFLRMARDGAVLSERTYTRPGGSGAAVADQAGDDRILGQLAGGATLVLQALHRTWPPLVEFGSALSAQLGHPVQINSYVTPAQNQGFAPHYDTHDVFVLQIAGTKRWIIHQPVIEHPLPDQPWDQRKSAVAARAAEPPLLEMILHPGDALYLPRGYLHAATALGELSVHLTVGIHPITGYRLAEAMTRALRDDAEIRRSLPVGVDLSDPQVLAGQLAAVAARVVAAAERPAELQETVAAGVHAALDDATRPAPLSPLAQLAAADALTATTPVRVRPGLRFRLSSGDSGATVRALGKAVTVPFVMSAALRDLLCAGQHRAGDLPGLDPVEQLVLVRRMMREGIIVPVSPTDR